MLQRRDKELFDKCVAARTTGDAPRAKLYAEECAEVRKIAKVVLQSELSLEQLIFKLETAEMLGDIVYLVSPVKNVVSTVGKQIQNLMPEVSFELAQINESLDGFTAEAGNVAEVVTIEANPVAVELSTPTVSTTINGDQARELSLNNRNWVQLITLAPGVTR